MDRPAGFKFLILALVDQIARDIKNSTQNFLAHRHRNRRAKSRSLKPSPKSIAHIHSDRADAIVSKVRGYL